jgi:hypothetical protein
VRGVPPRRIERYAVSIHLLSTPAVSDCCGGAYPSADASSAWGFRSMSIGRSSSTQLVPLTAPDTAPERAAVSSVPPRRSRRPRPPSPSRGITDADGASAAGCSVRKRPANAGCTPRGTLRADLSLAHPLGGSTRDCTTSSGMHRPRAVTGANGRGVPWMPTSRTSSRAGKKAAIAEGGSGARSKPKARLARSRMRRGRGAASRHVLIAHVFGHTAS